MHLENYPLSSKEDHPWRFQYTWSSIFPSWLEYSPSEDVAYCLPCYLFSKKPSGRLGSDVFIATGFKSWRKVSNGKNCALLKHIVHHTIDEAHEESKKEKMAFILRFVDKNGFIQERFFDIVHVKDTTTLTMKNELCVILSRHNLNVSNICGQGYDSASNMRGEWNGLQAIFLNDCPYAYYVHCFAHRLQLSLVAASREVIPIHQFFSKLTFIVNIVSSSSKRHDKLQATKLDEIAYLLEIDELETSKGANQICTLKRARDTRWSSHFSSICSLINVATRKFFILRPMI
uniref:Zinc finger MYM-type protein 1 n=1 Tax=Cajanus cajan TaxID=3821 RepID=A0A151R7B5_CAJCA|nr:Zinc finger MYM-type protein 1 [Cajanus cajan]